jgi:hypothetical protein
MDLDVHRAGQLTADLHEYRTAARDLLERARALLPASAGGTNDSWFAGGHGREARELLEHPHTSQLYVDWIVKVRELRAIYDRLQTPPSLRMVAGAGEPRTELEPDVELRIALYLAANRLSPNAHATNLVAVWRAQAA